ncbi:MAG: hypothetical protein GY726_11955 [Proteobacteria bacterium]|nr:hypothetical protein [Pseudomonadota bacterium]
MKESRASFVLVSMLFFFASGAFADSREGLDAGSVSGGAAEKQTPYISMNIGVEIAGLETAAEEAAQGLNLIGEALYELANNPELTEEHHQQIEQALSRVDELGKSLTLVVEQLPDTVDKSMAPVVNASNELSSQIKRTVILTAIALILIMLVALAAVYYFVLAPGTRSVIKTATLLDELANTLKTTAEIVEISSERNLQVMEEVRKVGLQSKQNK